jgi:hypothetical protein
MQKTILVAAVVLVLIISTSTEWCHREDWDDGPFEVSSFNHSMHDVVVLSLNVTLLPPFSESSWCKTEFFSNRFRDWASKKKQNKIQPIFGSAIHESAVGRNAASSGQSIAALIINQVFTGSSQEMGVRISSRIDPYSISKLLVFGPPFFNKKQCIYDHSFASASETPSLLHFFFMAASGRSADDVKAIVKKVTSLSLSFFLLVY